MLFSFRLGKETWLLAVGVCEVVPARLRHASVALMLVPLPLSFTSCSHIHKAAALKTCILCTRLYFRIHHSRVTNHSYSSTRLENETVPFDILMSTTGDGNTLYRTATKTDLDEPHLTPAHPRPYPPAVSFDRAPRSNGPAA
jgi:hypothetical protein